MKDYLLCFVSVFMLVGAQLILRYAAKEVEITSASGLFRLAFSPITVLALAVYGAAFLLWLYILSRVPLSFAYPIQALAFPLVIFLSMLLFHEAVPINRWVGVAIIVLGTAIAST